MKGSKWTKVLVPVDESIASKRALREAIMIARQCNSIISLLHVVPLSLEGLVVDEFSGLPSTSTSFQMAVSSKLREYGMQLLEDAAKKVESAGGVTVPFDKLPLGIGAPGEEIVAKAKALNCDVIIMGTHGRHGVERMMVGSVAEYVIRHAGIPVMCLRGIHDGELDKSAAKFMTTRSAVKRILFPYDNSDISKQTLVQLAVPMCKMMDAELHIHFHIERFIPTTDHDALLQKENDEAQMFLLQAQTEAAKTLGKDKLFTDIVVSTSHVADSICASAVFFDLVVVSTHGRRGLTRFIMGSVAESVLRSCSAPVLVFHAPAKTA